MLHGLAGGEAAHWINFYAVHDEVEELCVLTGDSFFESTGVGDPENAQLLVFDQIRRVVHVEVVGLLATLVNHRFGWHAAQFHDELELLLLVVAREQRLASVQLRQYAAKTPDVDLLCVLYPQNDFRGAVESRLHISIDLLIPEATRTKVDDLEVTAYCVCTKYVLRLQVTMDDLVLLEEDQTLQDLNGIVSDLIWRESNEAGRLQMLEQVGVEELKDKAVMIAEVSLVNHPNDVVLILWILLHDVLKVLSLLVGKLVVHLRVSCDLDGKDLFGGRFVVLALNYLSE